MRIAFFVFLMFWVSACNLLEDPATRLAYVIESEVRHLGHAEGARYTIRYQPSEELSNGGSYSVQFDKVGVLIVWYMDANGKVTESATTSYYSRFVTTPRTYKVDKSGDKALQIELERIGKRAVIVDVR